MSKSLKEKKQQKEQRGKPKNLIRAKAEDCVGEDCKGVKGHVRLALAAGYRVLTNLDVKAALGSWGDLLSVAGLMKAGSVASSGYKAIKSAWETKDDLADVYQDLIQLILLTDRAIASLKEAANAKLPLCSMREVELILDLILHRIKKYREAKWKNLVADKKQHEVIARDVQLLVNCMEIVNNEIAVVEAALNSAHSIKDPEKRRAAIRAIYERDCSSSLFTEGHLDAQERADDVIGRERTEEQEAAMVRYPPEQVSTFQFYSKGGPGGAVTTERRSKRLQKKRD